MFIQFWDVLTHLFGPFKMMGLAASYIPGTIFSLLSNFQFGILLSPSLFKEAWFSRFWGAFGPLVREGSSGTVAPLMAQAHGIVLDIGPGCGEWVHLFNNNRIVMIFGVEPNEGHHPRLRERIKEAGLEGKYVIVPVGVEELGNKWVEKNTVDSIVTVLCLCSIPTPKVMISGLYGYLKEGGYWILYEHVKVKKGRWVGTYQSLIDYAWPHFYGGCSITRDTEKTLKEAGPWNKVELMQPVTEPEYQVVPHLKGILVNRRELRFVAVSTKAFTNAQVVSKFNAFRTASSTIHPSKSPTITARIVRIAIGIANNSQTTHTPPQNPSSTISQMATNNGADNSDEWEYEYSITETDTYYVTLDLTIPEPPRKRKADFPDTKWANPAMGRSKRQNLGAPPSYGAGEFARPPSTEDSRFQTQVPGMRPLAPRGMPLEKTSSLPESEKEETEVQILDLHSETPIVSYKGHIFNCEWAENIGTEFLFTLHDDNNTIPSLRWLPGNVDLIAASSARLISTPLKVEHKSIAAAGFGRRRESKNHVAVNVGAAALPKRVEQGKFLEKLISIKEARGEADDVTITSQKRHPNQFWKLQFNYQRECERTELRRIINRGGKQQAEEAMRRIEEMDQEDQRAAALTLPGKKLRKEKGPRKHANPQPRNPITGKKPKSRRRKRVDGILQSLSPEPNWGADSSPASNGIDTTNISSAANAANAVSNNNANNSEKRKEFTPGPFKGYFNLGEKPIIGDKRDSHNDRGSYDGFDEDERGRFVEDDEEDPDDLTDDNPIDGENMYD